MSVTVATLHIYPIKSGAPLTPAMARVEKRGLAHDRRWMIIDPAGRFLTGRELPRLTLIRAMPDPIGLVLTAPAMPPLPVVEPGTTSPRIEVTVWDDRIEAALAAESAHAWLSAFLGRPCCLVFMDAACARGVDPAYARADDEVSFADGFPLLLISQAALDHLNTRLAQPVDMLQFRPNLVVTGCAAHAEDGWRRIRIGAVEFDLVKACTRCVFTTVDPQRGERRADGEPLRTLIGYRRSAEGVTFGQNLIARGGGEIRSGDAVEILEHLL